MCLPIHISINIKIQLFSGEKKKKSFLPIKVLFCCLLCCFHTHSVQPSKPDMALLQLLLGQGHKYSQKLNSVQMSLPTYKACERILQGTGSRLELDFSSNC